VDTGSRRIKLAQLVQRGGVRFALHAAASFARQAAGDVLTNDEAWQIEAVMRRRGFVGGRLALLAPQQLLSRHMFALPAGDAPPEALAHAEAARVTQRQPGTFELDCQLIHEPGGKSRGVFASVLAHDAAESMICCFEEADLEVVGCYAPASAMTAALEPLLPRNDELTCLVDIGWTQARLYAMARRQVIYERELSDGGLCAAFAAAQRQSGGRGDVASFAVDALQGGGDSKEGVRGVIEPIITALAEYLQEEIGASLKYLTKRHYGLADRPVHLAGGGAAMPMLVDAISREGEQTPVAIRPSMLMRHEQALGEAMNQPTLTLALGAAVAGASE